WMFLYAKRDFSTLDPATWAWLFSVVRAFLDKFAQWERWRDDRLAAAAMNVPMGIPSPGSDAGAAPLPFVAPTSSLRPPPGVAAGGRRLQRRVPWAAIVVFGALVVMFFLGQAGVFA